MVKGWLGTLPDSTGSCGHSDYFQPFVQADSSGSDGEQLPMLSKGASWGESQAIPWTSESGIHFKRCQPGSSWTLASTRALFQPDITQANGR